MDVDGLFTELSHLRQQLRESNEELKKYREKYGLLGDGYVKRR